MFWHWKWAPSHGGPDEMGMCGPWAMMGGRHGRGHGHGHGHGGGGRGRGGRGGGPLFGVRRPVRFMARVKKRE